MEHTIVGVQTSGRCCVCLAYIINTKKQIQTVRTRVCGDDEMCGRQKRHRH